MGCAKCCSGYIGSVGIYEISPFSAEVSGVVRRRGGEPELLDAARKTGFMTMFEDGVLKAARGETSLTEIFRVIGPVDPETDNHDHSADAELQPLV